MLRIESNAPDPLLTTWLDRLRNGDAGALDDLIPIVYEELRTLAHAQLRREDVGHTLGTTALVHEAYMRLTRREHLGAEDRRHFFAIAAQAMRRVLIDHARSRKRQKRGSGQTPLSLDTASFALDDRTADEVVALDGALDRLAVAHERSARVVELRYFAGLTLDETADVLGIARKTVQRDWTVARAWLRKEIQAELA
jgi:RNA polymerase sigma factor (TIGR02999 family)